jgi:hypothetical protein
VGARNDALLTLAGDLLEGVALPHLMRVAARLAAVGLLSAEAVLTGRMVGRMGQGTTAVRAIAPAAPRARPQPAAQEVAPWPLSESGAGRR